MRIQKALSLGLIIDIQEKLLPHIHNHEALVRNTEILIQGMQALELPVLATEQYTRGLGKTIPPIAGLLPQTDFMEKNAFSCCDDVQFTDILKQFEKQQYVIIAGIEAHVCVMQTAVDLIEQGFIPVIVEDCVSSRNENNKRIALQRMQAEGALITTYESILFELCRYAGNDTFKQISKLVK